MRIFEALGEGLRRLHSAKRIVLWLYLLNLAVAVVPTAVVSELIRKSTDHSVVAENLRDGFDDEWFREFKVEASGLAKTFQPSVTGLGAVLDGLDAFVSGEMFTQFSGIVGVGALFLLLWTFVTGGVLDVYLASGEVSRERFFAASARHFPRMLKLFLLAAVLYAAAYYLLLPGVEKAIQTVNRQTIDERAAFAWVIAKYTLVLGAVFLINLVFDYAKILAVKEDRKSAFLNAFAALRLMVRHPVRTVGLYLTVGTVGILFLLIYGLFAPGALQRTYLGVAAALLVGQAYILSRIWTRLLFFSSQSAMCEGLTHGPTVPSRGREDSDDAE